MELTGDGLYIGLLILGMFLMMLSRKVRNILLALGTFTIWFSLGLWLFFSTSAPIGFGDTWKEVLGWGFLILAWLPFLWQMDVEIRHEAQGKKWTKYGDPPTEKGPSAYEEYREKLYGRTRKGG